MGNKQEGGVFSPLVVVVRQAVGQSKFNQFRGKAISLHSQGNAELPAVPHDTGPGMLQRSPPSEQDIESCLEGLCSAAVLCQVSALWSACIARRT